MANNRDNFSSKVCRTLERRVNSRCSNPDCDVPTSGPNDDPNNATSMGIAAHICAAASGGPRYDSAMTPAQRASIDNGIWLCSNCSIIIDRDKKKFTNELLQNWKLLAERKAMQELGKPPVSRKDYELFKSIVLGDLPKKPLANAVADICRLSAQAIEEIDPRFSVDVEYMTGQTTYTLKAKEPVGATINVASAFQTEFREKLSALIDHGDHLEIDGRAVTIEGSPIFNLHNLKVGKFVVKSNLKMVAIVKLAAVDNDGNPDLSLDDITGHVTGGAKSVTFQGTAFGGLLRFEFRYDFSGATTDNCQVTTTMNYVSWNNKTVRSLPYFEKLYKWFEALHNQSQVHLSLEVEGTQLISATSHNFMPVEDANGLYVMFRYIRNIRSILRLLNIDLPYRNDFCVSPDEVRWTEKVYSLLFEYKKRRGKEIGSISFEMTLLDSPEAEEQFEAILAGEARSMRVEQTLGQHLTAFGREISIPRLSLNYSAMTLSAASIIPKIKPGKTIPLTMHPSDDCHVDVSLIG